MTDAVIVAIVAAIPASIAAGVAGVAAIATLRGNRTLGTVKAVVNGTATAARLEIEKLTTEVSALKAEIDRLYASKRRRRGVRLARVPESRI